MSWVQLKLAADCFMLSYGVLSTVPVTSNTAQAACLWSGVMLHEKKQEAGNSITYSNNVLQIRFSGTGDSIGRLGER